MDVRRARPDDVDVVTRCITLAFATDPVWSVALRPRRRADGSTSSRTGASSSRRRAGYGTVRLADDGAAVSVWLPPGGVELTSDGDGALEALLAAALDAGAVAAMHELYARFEAQPRDGAGRRTPT